jgi:CelD/BcsL family acetyltransferase involved in cellulose biosynthesis
MPGRMSVNILHTASEVNSIAADWRELWEDCPNATPFQRCEWMLPWIEVFAPDNLRVLEIRNGDQLIGLAPLLIYQRDSVRVLALAGGGVSDYLDALVHPAFLDEALSAILQSIDDFGSEWDIAEFTDLPPLSPLLRLGNARVQVPHDVCPVLPIPEGALQISDFVPARQLRNLRNSRHRLSRVGGGSVERATASTAAEFLDALIQLHSARWNSSGLPGVLSSSRLREFHRWALRGLLPGAVVRLYGLRCAGRLIAALYAVFERSTVYFYLQGFDPEFAWYSPGAQLIAAVIEEALREGKQQLDFLRGGESYKYAWGARDRLTSRLTYSGAYGSPAAPKSAA